jgi:hypothetical protein
MVLNRGMKKMDDGEPLSPNLDRDPMVKDDLVVGDRLAVTFLDGDGRKRTITGRPIRFDSWSSHHGFGGHNVTLELDEVPDWMADADPLDDRIRITTRIDHATVEANRPGAGLNHTISELDRACDLAIFVDDD